jgi:hypothetical protein
MSPDHTPAEVRPGLRVRVPIHTAAEVAFRALAGWVPSAAEHPRDEAANGHPSSPATLW